MTTLDWTAIGQWAAGIAGTCTLMFLAVQNALRRAQSIATEGPPPVEKTRIITTDSVAMTRLAGEVQTSNERALTTWQVMKELTEAIEANTKTVTRATEEVADARTDIRELGREIARSSRG